MKDAGITPAEIDEVVLVGGSTRIPKVRAVTNELFELSARGKKPHTELNPDEVVALGAAVQGKYSLYGFACYREHAAAGCHSAVARH